jgi:hypothetical protein
MVKSNSVILVCAGLLICVCLCFTLFPIIFPLSFGQKKQVPIFATYDAPFGKLLLATNISDIPQNMTLYRVTPHDNDMIDYWNGNPVNGPGNVTSEAEAPQVAKKILDKYGGLPEGAGPLEARTEYLERSSGIPWQPDEQIPDTTVINCQRSLDGKPVIGGFIRMELGRNGELLNLKKVWRTVTPAGTMQVIPATEALKKILRGNILNEGYPKCTCDLTVDKVQLAYLENDYNESQEFLEPVWVFKGTLSSGDSFSYRVSALDSPDKTMLVSVVHPPPVTDIKLDNQPTLIERGNNSY